ncbi:di-heme cytochrome c peroxidase [Salinisphaera sp. PC39]|uniref:FG-GAP-like repeat-containing protein n=1 Tax=Salinisphaera sp. PC39 TaxID=1304156 RepID=UPI00333F74C5
MLVLAVGCGGGGGGQEDDGAAPDGLDAALLRLAGERHGMDGDPASERGLVQVPPDSDPMVKLGQILFFSQTLSGGFDSACGTCHHPDFAGSDGLSIAVGVVPERRSIVGPERRVDHRRDPDPRADGGPNMHRNSLTTFNASLFDRAMMYDGRVFVLDDRIVPGGHGQDIRTPESGNTADTTPLDGLMEFNTKNPLVNDNEMRGFLYTDLTTPVAYRERLVARLRGQADTRYLDDPVAAAGNWLALFRDALGEPRGTAEELITIGVVQRALAAYIDAAIFVDTPWRSYLEGDRSALSRDAKRGAWLFLAPPDEGGLGCAVCHAGDRFTDEGYYNVGFPQIGRGFGRADRKDFGRWSQSRRAEDIHAFRVPSLLNVARTAPYGHAGTFASLARTIAYHADPKGQVDLFDFSLQHLEQFRGRGSLYGYAESHTREAMAAGSFTAVERLLPRRALGADELRQLTAFLESLTDRCVADPSCVGRWTPAPGEDPDGHLLVRGDGTAAPVDIDAERPAHYPDEVALAFPGLAPRATFADVEDCAPAPALGDNTGEARFTLRSADPGFGLADPHGFSAETWFVEDRSQLEAVMIAGGVTATYLNDDCWPDLAFAGGDIAGMRFYENLAGTAFRPLSGLLDGDPGSAFTGVAVADLDGDYRRELLLTNLFEGEIPIYSPTAGGRYARIAGLPMARHTFAISFSPLDETGYPYFYTSHWSAGSGNAGTSPALWRNDGRLLRPWDEEAGTTSAHVDQRFNFTSKFVDLTGDGHADLLIASDFGTSQTLVNDGDGGFVNVTDEEVVTDENGMGATLLDADNDGGLEWFVTSVMHPGRDKPAGNWGVTGNRLYRNVGAGGHLRLEDVTDAAGVRDGAWGWGACAADFDNDGFVDLFHVNGFGHIPASVDDGRTKEKYDRSTAAYFQDKPARLFMNDGDGTFTERASAWEIDTPSEGRGVVCFDYDRDGDVDVVVLDHSRGFQFFENRIGHGEGRRFLAVRLVGAAPNTDAIGARVRVTADPGNGHGSQTMQRLAQAASNYSSQNPPDLHFGLGTAAKVTRLSVTWPDGTELVCDEIPANRFLVLDRRDGSAACAAP